MKRLIGWLCYRFILAWPYPLAATGIVGWALSRAGEYADPGEPES